MPDKNSLSEPAKYLAFPKPWIDRWIKLILQFKLFPAFIAKFANPEECGSLSIEEIIRLISDPSRPFLFDSDVLHQKMAHTSVEDTDSSGTVRFDYLSHLHNDRKEIMLLNIEIQNHISIQKIVDRTIYYVSRLFSSQKNSDDAGFENDNYEQMTPVRSIWIFPFAGKKSHSLRIRLHSDEFMLRIEGHDAKMVLLDELSEDMLPYALAFQHEMEITMIFIGDDYDQAMDKDMDSQSLVNPALYMGMLFRNPNQAEKIKFLEEKGGLTMLTTIEKQEIKNVDGLNFFSDRQMRQFDEMEKQRDESERRAREAEKQRDESERRAREAEKQRDGSERRAREAEKQLRELKKQLRELKKSGMDEDAMNRLIYSWTEEEK
ncbi:hypothetical protein [Allobaculum sp. JKK-2023]|uniref:hypothetical protein n=1 Tax=Allobaculum sp. JKK-2023 TaxID=3108943 RepID=UPI002B05C458|nr:hypothetical protein [Allobaculum sp. JKK-2023]